ncbi:MAG: hypothetical protein Q9218_004278 [Villophora microphyllina]
MWSHILTSALLTASLASSPAAAQTYTTCNPLTSGSCPADPALGRSVSINFADGASDSFTPQGNPTFNSNGASFTVGKSGDSPQLTSKWYIMFGHVEFKIKPAPGVGIVSSAVLQSDDLDEIDWEWLGGDSSQVQSNYFGKGQTTTWNRGAFHANPNNQADFHTYTIDWTANQIAWQIDGKTVRTLSPNDAQGQYPQTPMMIKIGAWSGGDPSNAPGTVAWAGGSTNYAGGPYSMIVKSIAVTDYSSGSQYSYSGTSGGWQSIQSQGGKIGSGGGQAVAAVDASSSSSTSSESAPQPFSGTHRDAAVTTHANVYPWVATTLATSTTAPTTYPNLPSGYKTSQAVSSTSSPSDLSGGSAAGGGLETVTGYDQRGFPTTMVQVQGAAKQYNEQGFLITPTPSLAGRSSPTAGVAQAANGETTVAAGANKKVTKTSAAVPRLDSIQSWLVLSNKHIIVLWSIYLNSKFCDLDFWYYLFGHCSPPVSSSRTAEFRIAGQRFVFTADSENIKAVLATQFNDYGKGKDFLHDWEEFLGHGIFTTDGEEWANSRQLLRPQFVKTRIRDLEIFEKHVQQLLSFLGNQGTEIDISKLFYRYTLDAATEFLLGRSVDSLGNADSEFAKAFDEVQRIQTIRARAGPLQRFVPLQTFRRGLKLMASFIEPFIQEALHKGPGELDEKEGKEVTWLDSVAKFTRDRTVIRDQIVNILLAGRDTTAGTLSFLFKELSAQPRIYNKLRQEILEKVGSRRQPSYEDLKDMSYLQHCINETLRLYPAVPYNMRIALRDTTLPRGGGDDGRSPVGILKDTVIGYAPMYLHREPAQYPPVSAFFAPVMQFSPERWEKWTPRPWQYIPFNGGPRICIGVGYYPPENDFSSKC